MSKTKKIILWSVAVVVLAGVLVGGYFGLDYWAHVRHGQVYAQYSALLNTLEQATLTVTEGKTEVAVYDLEQIGLMEESKAKADACFAYMEKLTPEEFKALPFYERFFFRASGMEQAVVVDGQDAELLDVLFELKRMEREESQDAYLQWQEDGYTVIPEVNGTELDYMAVYDQMKAALTGWTLEEGMVFDVADCEAYLLPAVTEEDEFDFVDAFETATNDLVLPVKLLTETVELPFKDYVSVDEEGKSTVDTEALEALVEQWIEACPEGATDFILDSYERGPVALDFLKVTYELDREALLEQLIGQVTMLDATELKAPYICKRNGEDYTLGDTYVEIDIYRQKMTYFHEGEVIAFTDVVTGLPWGYWTWPGLYGVQNKDTDCQLTAPDYSVHVDYWVGYDGEYGIHDADWREEFGGDIYVTNGSHGCTNTPLEAMAAIYEKIEVGTPVIVHFVEEETEEVPAETA